MAKKKKVELEEVFVEEPLVSKAVEPVEVTDKLSVELVGLPDPLVSVVANGAFHDGAFKTDFEKLGYKVHWNDQEVRSIPARLYAKLQRRSGGKFALKGK